MVDFDIATIKVDVKETTELLEKGLHPAIRVLVRANRKDRWVQINLDKFYIVNNCYKFNGILSHTMYLNGKTFYQEADITGWYALTPKVGAITIF
jgi:hypothetical protein